MKKYLKSYLVFCLFCSVMNIGPAQTLPSLEITPDTTIQFKEKTNILVYVDEKNQYEYDDVLKKIDQFVPISQVGPLKPSTTYWIYQTMVSRIDTETDILIDNTGWEYLKSYIIRSDGSVTQTKPFGIRANHNPFLSASPEGTRHAEFTSQFPAFRLKKDEYVKVLTRASLNPIFPARSFSINFREGSTYSEYRRFGLYMEGILLGVLIALSIFSWFNAIQNKDKTNFYYAIWISIASLAVCSTYIFDGSRLFEFFISVNEQNTAGSQSSAFIAILGIGFSQAIFYVLFARHYLGIKHHFPKIYILSNLWIVYAIANFFLIFSGVFYQADFAFASFPLFKIYAISVGILLVVLFTCSYLRYRAGSGFALYFTFAIIPYIIFRASFLLGFLGMPSLFFFLPDQAWCYFLKNPATNQACGICLEAMIMALAVISRARWLQNELTASAQKQTELIEQQNTVLEATVAERTQELRQKHEELDESHQLVVGSVNYASRLQRGQLPRQIRIDGRFDSFSTIWEPRDTIGGDIYWLSSSMQSGPFVLAVTDCTGHGVPGAMLSLLVCNSLERIYANDTSEDPAKALLSLDHYVRTGLNQDRTDSESDDGCDAAILRIDRDKNIIEFAGAKLSLFQVTSDGTVTRHQASRCSLGYQSRISAEDMPVNQTISYKNGDVFAIATDGLTDQIGGGDRRISYGYRRLENLLKSHCTLSAEEITAALKNDVNNWEGSEVRRDDVTAVVFRL